MNEDVVVVAAAVAEDADAEDAAVIPAAAEALCSAGLDWGEAAAVFEVAGVLDVVGALVVEVG